MRAMILAAGRGERMRPLTDTTPKPLLQVAGKPLIHYHLEALHRVGVDRVVINLGHLGQQIRAALGQGEQFGLAIDYSDEGDNILETAGGIVKALPLLGDAPFIVDFAALPASIDSLAHLVMVANPAHHPRGDFALEEGLLFNEGEHSLTYSGIGVYQPALFQNLLPEPQPLAPLLRQAAEQRRLGGQYHAGRWDDVGTPERLNRLNSSVV